MRFLVWTGVEEWLTEAASVEIGDGRLSARGIQLGAEPVPFRVDYRLECLEGFVTRELELTATAEGWRRHLLLNHDESGGWRAEVHDDGDVPGGRWDGDLPDLSGARDIDIENSPLTNTMPILRHGFQTEGEGDFLMAFVRTPTLRVEASPQRYEHVRTEARGSVVRYLSRDGDFTAELELDADGLLEFYPRLARRIEPNQRAPARR
ncbi:MAG TPA: putative glycolipid-binding domain-containing protein [Solirubrobacterales bacterium]